MSANSDADIRLLAAEDGELSEEQQERLRELDGRRKARSGDWSEAELEQVAVFNQVPEGRTRPQADLRRALLGVGEMDRIFSLQEAASLLAVPPESLVQAAKAGQLAVIREAGDVFTSESRLGAMILSHGEAPACEFSTAARMLFVCGFMAGIRAPKQP